MGMSIDETIEHGIDELEWIKSTGIYPYGNTQDKLHTDDYIDVVIDTMRKYQYIQEIYKSWRTGDYKGSTECMEEIGEVLENGNVD